MSLNTCTIMGRLTRDPDLRMTPSEMAVTSFTLAVDRDIPNRDGSRDTDFIDCVAWRGTAEFVSRNFFKGSMAIVKGRLQMREWTDKDGNKRRNAEIVADNVYFGQAKDTRTDRSYGEVSGPAYSELSDADGELPF